MKRLWLLVVVIGPPAAFAWAEGPPSAATGGGRLLQLQRNHALIQTLVDGGLRLAKEEDPLQRASCCKGLAESLAGEIQQAAVDREGPRALELGEHLQAMLERGVAGNLSRERGRFPVGSAREKQLHQVGDRMIEILKPLEGELQGATEADRDTMRRAIKAVRAGRTQVENALRP